MMILHIYILYVCAEGPCSAAKNFDCPNIDDPLHLIPLLQKKSASSRALGVLKLLWKEKQLI